jgi:hypothetical protein
LHFVKHFIKSDVIQKLYNNLLENKKNERTLPMNEDRDLEIDIALNNMISDLEKQIKEPLNEEQTRKIFKTIFHCLIHLSSNKLNKL